MPTYEYRCKDCGQPLEVVQKFTDDPLTVCPECGGRLRKVFGNIGITFKGSGFYKTDSRNGAKPAEKRTSGDGDGASAKDKDTSKSSSSDGASKSDSKASANGSSASSSAPAKSSDKSSG